MDAWKLADRVASELSQPKSLREMDLPQSFVESLVLKSIYYGGTIRVREISKQTGLHWRILEEVLLELNNEGLVGSVGGGPMFVDVQYSLTPKGIERARELAEKNPYAGMAPVPYGKYREIMDKMSRAFPMEIPEDVFERAFEDVVNAHEERKILREAVSSGRGVFLYGPPGTGKTFLASKIAKMLPPIVIPKYVLFGDAVIKMFSPEFHKLIDNQPEDPRWAKIEAPFVFTGAELTTDKLEGRYNPAEGVYEVPPQVKAHGGVFLIDDIGRQPEPPSKILNRLIVPMENGKDIIYIAGVPVELYARFVPVFSTNLNIAVIDEAHLRRAPYLVYMRVPRLEDLLEVFRRNLEMLGERYDQSALDAFLKPYREGILQPNFSHARDVAQMASTLRKYSGADLITGDIVREAMKRHVLITLRRAGVDVGKLGRRLERRITTFRISLRDGITGETLNKLLRVSGIVGVAQEEDSLLVDAEDRITPTRLARILGEELGLGVRRIEILFRTEVPLVDEEELERVLNER